MDDKIELGGNIKLKGVKSLESGYIAILKKMIGNYAKEISDEYKEFKKLVINFKSNDGYEVESVVSIGDKEYKAQGKDLNLFFAVNKSFKSVKNEFKKENEK